MQTTNFKNFLTNFSLKEASLHPSEKKLPAISHQNRNESRKKETNTSCPKGLEELLGGNLSQKSSIKSSRKQSFSPILEHLSLLKNIASQIIPLFPKNLQRHLQIGQLKKDILVIHADSAQSARLARGHKDEVHNQLKAMPDPLSKIKSFKILVNPSLKENEFYHSSRFSYERLNNLNIADGLQPDFKSP